MAEGIELRTIMLTNYDKDVLRMIRDNPGISSYQISKRMGFNDNSVYVKMTLRYFNNFGIVVRRGGVRGYQYSISEFGSRVLIMNEHVGYGE